MGGGSCAGGPLRGLRCGARPRGAGDAQAKHHA